MNHPYISKQEKKCFFKRKLKLLLITQVGLARYTHVTFSCDEVDGPAPPLWKWEK